MNTYTTALCGTVISILSAFHPIPGVAGSIILRDKDQSTCSLTAPAPGQTEKFNLTSPGPCKDIKVRSLELIELPSATRVLLTDADSCSKDLSNQSNWYWIELMTRRKSSSLGITEIQYLITWKEPAMINASVQMMGWKLSSEATASSLRDTLSCIQVSLSKPPEGASPPPSSPSK